MRARKAWFSLRRAHGFGFVAADGRLRRRQSGDGNAFSHLVVASLWEDAVRTEIPIPIERLDEFCRRWKIAELRVFGSALREDFRPDKDLDLLVGFAPDADWSLIEHVATEEELTGNVGRKVDLVSQRAIERSANWIRREAVLDSAGPHFVSR